MFPLSRLPHLLLATLTATGPVFAGEFDNIARSPFVHCAFYRGYEVDRATGDLTMEEGKSDILVHFQGVSLRTSSARAIDTRMAGGRTVRVINRKYLHFIDNVGGMYVTTTIYGCLERDERRGVCITYGAMNARHFDARVMHDPDKVYELIKASAAPGFCDHSFIGIQEASTRKPPLQ